MKRGLTSTVAANIGWQMARRLRAVYGACAGKSSYASASHARTALAIITAKAVRTAGRPVPIAVYECLCGSWHLTSRGLVEHEVSP